MADTEETGYQVGPNDLAFPSITYEGIDSSGLTKREYFAAMALSGLLTNGQSDVSVEGDAKDAVRLADALISELNK